MSVAIPSSVDRELTAAVDTLVATSDSQVIDRCSGGVIDLPRLVLEREFAPRFVQLEALL
jgi:hypothetical protein